ncbi:MAG TPA: malonic semialdehyde reductase [Streptosporangiaceae bacterium]|nr:malonic semialdehyde reductase [Streptosporangiaceae bacterium]
MNDTMVLTESAQDLLFREARTANTFTDEPVGDDIVNAIYELVKWAPTSYNQQPLRVVLVRSPEARARLVHEMIDGNKQKTTAAPLTAILAADNDFHRNIPTQFPVFPNAKDILFGDPDRREIEASLNATLQVAYFILGIRAAGLAAGPMSGFDADAVAKEFFPDGRHRALVVINIGRPGPQAWYPRLPRLDYDQVFSTV